MPRKKKSNTHSRTQCAFEPKIPKELVEQLVTQPITQSEFESLFRALKKAVIERAMNAEMSAHLGYEHGQPKPFGETNQRNRTSAKTVITENGSLDIQVRRGRVRSFEPLIIPQHARPFS